MRYAAWGMVCAILAACGDGRGSRVVGRDSAVVGRGSSVVDSGRESWVVGRDSAVVGRGSRVVDSGRGSWVVGRDSAVVGRGSRVVVSGAFPETAFGLGRKATAAEIKAWNISVNPAGSNLPPGKGTFASGEKVFAAKCASCHGAQGEGMPPTYPKLVQAEPKDFSFDTDYKIPHTVGNYWPYATTLYDYINRAMPLTEPGSLTPDEVYGVVAYLLAANGVIAQDAVMDRRSLPKVEMPARARFVDDDRSGGTGFR